MIATQRQSAFIALMFLGAGLLQSQGVPPTNQAAQPITPPPPATKMEGFKPSAGTVITLGYDELGRVGQGTSVDVREIRDSKGASVRGLQVEVRESQYRTERSFIDADEIPELLKGFDALLEIQANPTQFKSFEVRYTTRGEFQLTAYSNSRGAVAYSLKAGRTIGARDFLSVDDMRKLRNLFDSASKKLSSLELKN